MPKAPRVVCECSKKRCKDLISVINRVNKIREKDKRMLEASAVLHMFLDCLYADVPSKVGMIEIVKTIMLGSKLKESEEFAESMHEEKLRESADKKYLKGSQYVG